MQQLSVLERLQAQVERTRSARERAAALTRLGIALAQSGRVEDSILTLSRLRLFIQENRLTGASIGVLTLDGVITYYRNRDLSSLDRLKRAFALASAAGDSALIGQAAAWLAFLAYNFDDIDALGVALGASANCIDQLSHSERARFCLTVADIIQFSGDWSEAGAWYQLTRNLSRRAHDHALLVATEFNRLAIGLSRFRLNQVLNIDAETSTKRAWLLELNSVRQLHRGFDIESLMPLLTHCEAWQAEAAGRFSDAALYLRKLLADQQGTVVGFSRNLLQLEASWCDLMADGGHSLRSSDLPPLAAVLELSLDEQLIAYYYYNILGEKHFSAADMHLIESGLREGRLRCLQEMKRMRDVLDRAFADRSILLTQIDDKSREDDFSLEDH